MSSLTSRATRSSALRWAALAVLFAGCALLVLVTTVTTVTAVTTVTPVTAVAANYHRSPGTVMTAAAAPNRFNLPGPAPADAVAAGQAGGNVTSQPAGLDCNGQCNWLTLTVTRTGRGQGNVTSQPPDIDCGSNCSALLDLGAVLILTATPGADSTFTGWLGACQGLGECHLMMARAQVVTATFELNGIVWPQAATAYFGNDLRVLPAVSAAGAATVTHLVVFTGTAPAGLYLLGVEGSQHYTDATSTTRLINRLLLTGCSGGPCTAVQSVFYAPGGAPTEDSITAIVPTDHTYLPHLQRH